MYGAIANRYVEDFSMYKHSLMVLTLLLKGQGTLLKEKRIFIK
jgi:hypothetical protein